jgi:hypothetical protein
MRNDALLTGDAAWLPFIYTLQGLYLVYNPVQLGLLPSAAILVPLLLVFFFFFGISRVPAPLILRSFSASPATTASVLQIIKRISSAAQRFAFFLFFCFSFVLCLVRCVISTAALSSEYTSSPSLGQVQDLG